MQPSPLVSGLCSVHPSTVVSCRSTLYLSYRLHFASAIPNESRPALLIPWKFEDAVILRQRACFQKNTHSPPIPTQWNAGGFNFGRCESIHGCNYSIHSSSPILSGWLQLSQWRIHSRLSLQVSIGSTYHQVLTESSWGATSIVRRQLLCKCL